jgi:hypothetical protein
MAHLAAQPDYRKELEKQAFEVLSSTPDQYPGFMKQELEKWGRVITIAGIKR